MEKRVLFDRAPRYTRQFWSHWAMYECLIRTPEYRKYYDKFKALSNKNAKQKLAEVIKNKFYLTRIVNPYNDQKNDQFAFKPSCFRDGRSQSRQKFELKLPSFVDLSKLDESIIYEFKQILKQARKRQGYVKPCRKIKLAKVEDYLRAWEMTRDGLTTREIAVQRNPVLGKMGKGKKETLPKGYFEYLDYLDELLISKVSEKSAELEARRKFPGVAKQIDQMTDNPKVKKLKSEMKKVRENLSMATQLIEGGFWRQIR